MYNSAIQGRSMSGMRPIVDRISVKYLLLSVLSLFVAGLAVFFITHTTPAQAACSDPCPYDGNGNFIGYPKAWPPGCIYIIPGLPNAQSGNEVPPGSGHYVWNQGDRNGSTRAPQCYPSNVSAFGFTYFERGHRMFNVGTYIDRNGCAQKYKADGSPAGTVCFNMPGSQYGQGDPGGDNLVVKTEEGNFTIGWIDEITSDGVVKGWAYDSDATDATVDVHLYVDGRVGKGTLLTSGKADQDRPDVNDLFKIEGKHGFVIKLPDSLRDGKPHTIYAYGIDTNGGSNRELGGGGKTFTGTGTTGTTSTNPMVVTVDDKTVPVGWLDSVSCVQFNGWAFDQDNPTANIDVHFYLDVPPGKEGAKVFGSITTGVQRDDVNALYKITGTHGFVYRFASVLGNPLSDGKQHSIYAYAINTNGGANPLLGGAPKTLTCKATTSGGGGGGGGGGSSRHNYLSSCENNGDFDGTVDPAVSGEVRNDGTISITITPAPGQPAPVIKDSTGAVVTPTRNADGSLTYTYKTGAGQPTVSTVTVGGHVYTIDTDGLTNPGDTVSVLVPVPCIRIGYDDILGGQQCGEGEAGTCAKELDAFINVDGIQNTGLHISVPPEPGKPNNGDDFSVQYKIVGDQVNKPWTDYDWRNCGQYSNHCIRLKGKGVISARTRLTGTANHFSLVTSKAYDADTGDQGLGDYDPL